MRVATPFGLLIGGVLVVGCSARETQKPTSAAPTPRGGSAGAGGAIAASGGTGSGGGLVIVGTGGLTESRDDGPTPDCTQACLDFPEAPIFDDSGSTPVPSDAPALFGAPGNSGASGVCVFEPQLGSGTTKGALFPANWLRPRFRFAPLAGENLWEIRIHAAIEAHELVAYTTTPSWSMPKEIWDRLARNVHNQPITVTIRGLNTAAAQAPSRTTGFFEIAPVFAEGTMVYWATTSSAVDPEASKLVGFRVGDESVIEALTVEQAGQRGVIQWNGNELRTTPDPGAVKVPGHVQCIGCHVSTPDGEAVAFTDVWPWNEVLASVQEETVGQQPAYVTAGAARLLNQPWLGMATFSKGLWDSGKKIMVSSYATRSGGASGVGFTLDSLGKDTLAWFDLTTTAEIPWVPGGAAALNNAIAASEGTAWGRLKLDGETGAAISPSFSHDGTQLAYTSATSEQDGRIGANNNAVDVHLVPYANGQGGTVTPLAGASEPAAAEYYPSFSANDQLVAFTKVATLDSLAMYYRPEGEIFVVPAAGGAAKRLSANDPVACSGEKSPGVINSWPKWSPAVPKHQNKNYYFLIFSSARQYDGSFELPKGGFSPPDTRASQLYMTAMIEDVATQELTTYGAVYLWNQEPTTSNLTPAWDTFKIPKVPPPPK